MREKVIEKKLAEEVKRRGGLCEKWNSGTSGWPDRIVLLPDGKFGFVEVKAPGEEQSFSGKIDFRSIQYLHV